MKKIISSILTLATIVGCLAVLPFGVFARDSGDVMITIPISDPKTVTDEILEQNYSSAQEKLDNDPNMVCYITVGTKQLWANAYTGEVYVKDTQTGQILNSNPYSLSGTPSSQKYEVMSQLIINYSSTTSSTTSGKYMYSFTEAAERGQITLVQTKDGIRMDYIIGDTTKRYVMPYGIMATDFIETVMVPMQKSIYEMIRTTAEENGVPQDVLDESFDFEAYCEKYAARYSTIYKYGVEYTFGNIDAFDAWLSVVDAAYLKFYNANISKNPNLTSVSDMERLWDDFLAINQVYIEISAYNNRKKQPNPSSWGSPNEDRLQAYPILAEKYDEELGYYTNSIFVLDTTLTSRQLSMYESIFSAYAPDFTLDDAYAAEEETGVSPLTVVNPVFYASLYYTLTEDGLTVSLPATTLVYDETLYTVNFVSVLPYFGTGRITEGGYVFYPDGSGTIIEFEDFESSHATLDGKVYGQDYAYYTISGQHQETIAMPVFGTVKTENTYYFTDPYDSSATVLCTAEQYNAQTYTVTFTKDDQGQVWAVYPYGLSSTPVTSYTDDNGRKQRILTDSSSKSDPTYYDNASFTVKGADQFFANTPTSNGYLAIIEEGASLATLHVSLTPDSQNPFSSVYASYVPRAQDSYDLMDSMSSITSSATFTVQADNKYLGSYTTHYVMLSDDTLALEAGLTSYYPASYVGMAAAYRQYLVDEGVLTALSDLQDQLPLYIETFGVIQTTKKILSIPFTVDAALTTFDDIRTMYEELAATGITNIKFRLTGYTNGGMTYTYPTKLKWERKAGGKSGYKELLAYAQQTGNGLEIFPNFNFAYVVNTSSFDGVSLKKIGARSVDNRYAQRKAYDSVYQQFTSKGGYVVSANYLEGLFAKFHKKNSKYGNTSISLDYMASDVSTDFSEDNLLTREDSLQYITQFLKTVRESGYSSVMTTGGNAYAFRYVDYLLKAPIDSSHYRVTSNTVPFWGMVVHGYLNYAGNPFNEQANKAEALLRAIESGASLYFLLSYDNTRLLKDDTLLSDYYSVDYQISKDTVESYYKILNDAIGDLQSYLITNHQRIYAERVGIESDIAEQRKTLEDEFMAQLAFQTLAAFEAQRNLILAIRNIAANIDSSKSYDEQISKVKDALLALVVTYGSDPRIAAIVGDETDEEKANELVFEAILNGTLSGDYGQSIGVVYDTDAVLASAKLALYTDTLDEAFEARILAYLAESAAEVAEPDVVARVGAIDYTSEYSYFTYSTALDDDYQVTESTVSNGTVVMVTYSNGTNSVSFLLNFNIFSVNVKLDDGTTVTLGKYGFLRLEN